MPVEVKIEANRLPEARAPLLNAHLSGVALTSPDPRALADFYESAMGYAGAWDGERWAGTLDGRWLTLREGQGNRLDHAAFAARDSGELQALRNRLDQASIPFETHGDVIEVADPDGNVLRFAIADRVSAVGPDSILAGRLQHLVFASDDAEAMTRFYCDAIGFAPSDYVKDAEGGLTSAFLRCSAEHHSLAVFRAPRKRLDHLCYDVADWARIRDWADHFAERHITLRWGPGRHGPGNNLFFFINDPDGNWLEFSSELDLVEGASAIRLWAHEERTLNSWGTALLRS